MSRFAINHVDVESSRLHLLHDHDGYLPSYALILDSSVSQPQKPMSNNVLSIDDIVTQLKTILGNRIEVTIHPIQHLPGLSLDAGAAIIDPAVRVVHVKSQSVCVRDEYRSQGENFVAAVLTLLPEIIGIEASTSEA